LLEHLATQKTTVQLSSYRRRYVSKSDRITVSSRTHCTAPNALHRTDSNPSNWLHGMLMISHITAAPTISLLSMCHALEYQLSRHPVMTVRCVRTDESCQQLEQLCLFLCCRPQNEAGGLQSQTLPRTPPNIPGVPPKNGCGNRS